MSEASPAKKEEKTNNEISPKKVQEVAKSDKKSEDKPVETTKK